MSMLKPAQAVIYTFDMEPITIIDMKPWYWDYLYHNGKLYFHVLDTLSSMFNIDGQFCYRPPKQLTVHADAMFRGTELFFILKVGDEVTALLLEPGILPGQRRLFNEEKKKAFAKGVLAAFTMGCGD